MNATKFISDWLSSMVQKYNWLKYKYEFKNGTHFIAVFPQSIIEFDEDYCRQENLFYDSFVAKYPNEDIYFGIEENFFTCSKEAFVFEAELNNSFEVSVNNEHEIIDLFVCNNNNCNNMFPNSNGFLLAA